MSEINSEQDLAFWLSLETFPMIDDLPVQTGSVSVQKPEKRKPIWYQDSVSLQGIRRHHTKVSGPVWWQEFGVPLLIIIISVYLHMVRNSTNRDYTGLSKSHDEVPLACSYYPWVTIWHWVIYLHLGGWLRMGWLNLKICLFCNILVCSLAFSV